MSVCEASECSNEFTAPPSKQRGKNKQRFCSGKCRVASAGTVRDSGASIPTNIFMSSIEHLLGAVGEDRYTRLAIACNLKADSLNRALLRDRIDFDLADLVLCKLNAVHLWWTGPLSDIYWNVELA